MAVQQGGSDGQEIGVAGVVNLDDTPGVLASTDRAATNLDGLLRADNSEGHQTAELGVFLDRILVVLLDIVREVVDGDAVVLNVLHHQLLGLSELGRRQGVGATDHGDDVDTGSESLHELDIQLAETTSNISTI